jgi:SAM-dependent methyltransferase
MQHRCPVCCHQGMDVFIQIEDVPVHCNLLWPTREAALNAPRGDIRLASCNTCGMIYNLAFDPSRMRYAQAYENSLHSSPRFQAYAEELAARMIEKYQLQGKTIIEVGCGKGEFLSLLCRSGGNRGIGFDPSYDGRVKDQEASQGLHFIRDYYSAAYAAYSADLICCRQVLEHIQDPRDFLQRLRQTVGDRRETVVFFEVPNVLYTIRDLGIWDIIYEHCSYFSAPSLTRIFQEVGFTVSHVYVTFGDQFLCVEASQAMETPSSPTEPLEDVEELLGLVRAFEEHYRHKVGLWTTNLNQLRSRANRVVVWGAGSKGVTFLNTVRNGHQVGYVVDINPRKQGMYVAGTGQRIVAPEFLHGYRPDTVLVMNSIYKDEIRDLLRRLKVLAEIVTV